MKKKIYSFFHGELFSSVIFIILGLLMCIFPTETIQIITKVVFGLLLIGTGCYHLYSYLKESKDTTVLDMFTGVIVLFLGVFFFQYPQVVVKLLPKLLGAMLVVDCIWVFRDAKRLRKKETETWKAYLFGSLIFLVLGLGLMWNPFSKITQTVIMGGVLFVLNGVADIAFYCVYEKQMKKTSEVSEEKETSQEENTAPEESVEEYEEYDPTYANSVHAEEEEIIDAEILPSEQKESEAEEDSYLPKLPEKEEKMLEDWIS